MHGSLCLQILSLLVRSEMDHLKAASEAACKNTREKHSKRQENKQAMLQCVHRLCTCAATVADYVEQNRPVSGCTMGAMMSAQSLWF